MSAEEDIKRLENMIDAITLRIVKWLTTETIRGAYYSFIGDFVVPKIRSVLRSNKSEEEKLEEIIHILKQAQERPPPTPPPKLENEIRQMVRSIVEDELRRARIQPVGQPVQPAQVVRPAQQVQPASQPAQVLTPPVVVQRTGVESRVASINAEIREIEEDIRHYKKILRKLEDKYYSGEISKDEYLEKKSELEKKIDDLKLRKERLERMLYA